jgi:hypothetical protein
VEPDLTEQMWGPAFLFFPAMKFGKI